MEFMRPSVEQLKKDGKNFILAVFLCGLYLYLIQKIFGAVCWVRLAFGFPCPFCGITRAAGLFLKGDFAGAFQMHAMFYPVLLFLPFYAFCKYFVKNGSKIIKRYVIIFLIVTTGYYVYRIVYLYPEQEPVIYYPDNWFVYIRVLIANRGN